MKLSASMGMDGNLCANSTIPVSELMRKKPESFPCSILYDKRPLLAESMSRASTWVTISPICLLLLISTEAEGWTTVEWTFLVVMRPCCAFRRLEVITGITNCVDMLKISKNQSQSTATRLPYTTYNT
uniref:Uncharacterized protein n=1 Tax=Glossina austeni TaxID=7395 RepID=A0A1A9V4W0_GLOAU